MCTFHIRCLASAAGIGFFVLVVLSPLPVFAGDDGNYRAVGWRFDKSADASEQKRAPGVCHPRSLRGPYPQSGSVEVFAVKRCVDKLTAPAESDGAQPIDNPSASLNSGDLDWGVHVGHDKIMFSIGAKW